MKVTRQAAQRLVGGIYVIIDPDFCGGRDITTVAEAVVQGGVAAIQLRHKHVEKSTVLAEAQLLAEICRTSDTLLIINDYPDIAEAVGADGVHVGQNDLSIAECRAILRPHQIVGKSNALLSEAESSFDEGADYVAVGSIFTTTTKSDTRPAGLSTLRLAAERISAPIVAIGGINAGNISDVADAGADGVCVATAVTQSADPEQATRELTRIFVDARSDR